MHTFYLLAIAIYVPFVTIYEIFKVKICMTLNLTFRIDQGQM